MTALTAALVLAVAIGVADARRFELSNTGIRVVWTAANPLIFAGAIKCEVTIEGTFHSRTLSKVSGQLVGFITRAAVHRPCTGGEAWTLNGIEVQNEIVLPNTLPWHLRYDSFVGTLPNIASVRLQLVGAAFLVLLGVECLYESTERFPLFGDVLVEAGGIVTGLRPLETRRVRKKTGGILCPAEGELTGLGRVTLLGTETAIRIRLVL